MDAYKSWAHTCRKGEAHLHRDSLNKNRFVYGESLESNSTNHTTKTNSINCPEDTKRLSHALLQLPRPFEPRPQGRRCKSSILAGRFIFDKQLVKIYCRGQLINCQLCFAAQGDNQPGKPQSCLMNPRGISPLSCNESIIQKKPAVNLFIGLRKEGIKGV